MNSCASLPTVILVRKMCVEPVRLLFRFLFAAALSGMMLLTITQAQEKGDVFPSARVVAQPEKPTTKTSADGPETASPVSGALRLGGGDLIEVSAYNVPEFSTKARVGNNGDVYLPLINYVHIAGLTIEEAQAIIEKRLADGGFLKDPHVTIFVDEYSSQSTNVLGEVAKPGVYPVLGQQHLLDVISAAGGLTDRAGTTVVITHREQPDAPITVSLNASLAGNGENNVDVFPGDTVVVQKAPVIYVVGDVQRPSGLVMNNGNLTVLQAIALAGGTTRTSKLSGVRIIRKGPEGIKETRVELNKILQAKQPDIAMHADDILFVPSSAAKSITARTLDTVVQTASALTLVAARP
jgi:polysaccharide biosynthesis/export protein